MEKHIQILMILFYTIPKMIVDANNIFLFFCYIITKLFQQFNPAKYNLTTKMIEVIDVAFYNGKQLN